MHVHMYILHASCRAAAMSGGSQFTRSPRSSKNPVATAQGSSTNQYPPPPMGGSGVTGLASMPPGPTGQIPGGMLPIAPKSSGLLGAAPGHVGLLGPPPVPPSALPSQGGMMHPGGPSTQPTHLVQGSQAHASPYVVELTDLCGTLSLEEMTERIRSRGFPKSCDFVLQLLDRYMYMYTCIA